MKNLVSDLRIGWVSHHIEGVKPLEELLSNQCPIKYIITLEEDLLNKRSGAADYQPIAEKFGIELHRVRNINDVDAISLLKSIDVDALFVIGWSQILHAEALNVAKLGCFGAHASLLPANRGSAPINWSLIKGETKTGNTLMKLSEKLDAGDIVAQREIEILPYDNVFTLYNKVANTNSAMLQELVELLKAGSAIEFASQNHIDSPLLPRRRPEDGIIDWNKSAADVYNFIRALTKPYPGAFFHHSGDKYYVWRSSLLPLQKKVAASGEVLGSVYSDDNANCGIAVACETGAVVLLEVENSAGDVFEGKDLAEMNFEAGHLNGD